MLFDKASSKPIFNHLILKLIHFIDHTNITGPDFVGHVTHACNKKFLALMHTNLVKNKISKSQIV